MSPKWKRESLKYTGIIFLEKHRVASSIVATISYYCSYKRTYTERTHQKDKLV